LDVVESTQEEVARDAVDGVAVELGEAFEDVLSQRDGFGHVE
jgi:hypothetical protein